MKAVVLVPLLAVIAACGGGGGDTAESAKPTIVECMTPKAGVKFETINPKAPDPDANPATTRPNGLRYDVVEDVFEGQPALSVRVYGAEMTINSQVVRWQFVYSEDILATESRVQLLGVKGPVDHPDGYMRLVYSPPVTTPATLTIGTPTVREYTSTFTRSVAGAADEVRTVSRLERIEWLGYEDISLSDGRILSNVCKLKVTRDGQPVGYEWYAVGYGRVAQGSDVDGKPEMWELISRIEQAP